MELSAVHSSRVQAAMQQPGQAVVGIVLAGGGSTRLASVAATGGGKALLTVQGKTFLEHVVGSVAAETDRTIVVAAAGQILPALDGVQIVRDSTPGAGPLAGIRDGLRAAVAVGYGEDGEHAERAEHACHAGHAAAPPAWLAFVTSCDVPLLRREVVRLLIDVAAASDAVWTIPIVHGHGQVLVSVMRVEALPQIEAWLATGRRDLRGLCVEMARNDPRSVREVTEEACKAVDPTLESFDDIDTPGDFQQLQSR
jgi:molybdopterin-guanine dinucleotide biosynthesis protein A